MEAVWALTVMPRSRSTLSVSVNCALSFFSFAEMFPVCSSRQSERVDLPGIVFLFVCLFWGGGGWSRQKGRQAVDGVG